MATSRKRRGGGGASSQFKSFMSTALIFVLVGAGIWGWWKVNDFKDAGDVIEWFRGKSAELSECINDGMSSGKKDAERLVDTHGCFISNIAPGEKVDTPETSADKAELLAMLEAIPTAPSEVVDYNRSEWKHWLDLDKDGCNTRQEALIAAGTAVVKNSSCKVTEGVWVEQYAGIEYTDPSKMDLDHIVPLAWAASNGGQIWLEEKKTSFANDPLNLFLSDATENRAKGAKGPAEYLPPNENFQCLYVARFVQVSASYGLSMPSDAKNASRKVIEKKC